MITMEYIYSFTVALFLTVALIPLLIRFSAKLQLIDAPTSERKMHDKVMPRSGGIAIIAGVFVPLAFTVALDHYLASLFFGCLIIVLFGLLDDKYELNYKWKLFGQSLAAIIVMAGGIVIFKVPFCGLDPVSPWIAYPLTFFFLLGVINGVNFSDGLDGLAAGTSLLSLATIVVLAIITENHSVTLIAMTVIGGILGFLRFNTHPAQIFMGDAGSQFLGFIIVCLAILVTQVDTSALNPFLPVLLLGLPIMDILQVVPVRIKKGLPLPGPDKEHFHHQLVKLSFHHHEVVAIIYVLQLVMMVGTYFLRFESDFLVAGFYALYLFVVLGTLFVARVSGWAAREGEINYREKDRRNQVLRKLGWIHQHGGEMVLVMLLLFFALTPFAIGHSAFQLSGFALVLALLFVIVAIFSRLSSINLARVSCYSASVIIAYLIAVELEGTELMLYIDGFLAALAAMLMLAIRTTRREHFRLDTQDLLILFMVLIIPQLPFNTMNKFAIGSTALRLAVLMYSCEFLLAREGHRKYRYLCLGSTFGLLAIGLVGLR